MITTLNVFIYTGRLDSEKPHDHSYITVWFAVYGLQALTSISYFAALIREINRGYITRNGEVFAMIIDIGMFLWSALGHYLYYRSQW